ncbi:MAG TPA: PIN domain-containing protein [Bryobacteraceae bacterium]|nr:PIN domain-containing protein [Bryobacteraceae bacterium]
MAAFVDTSVLVAASWIEHPHHEASFELLASANKDTWYCGLHTLAELYSSLTALPVRPAVAPGQAMLMVEDAAAMLTVVALDLTEYLRTLREGSEFGAKGGLVYDALLLACARKSGAEAIYTWNVKHFHRLAPDLAGRIRTP